MVKLRMSEGFRYTVARLNVGVIKGSKSGNIEVYGPQTIDEKMSVGRLVNGVMVYDDAFSEKEQEEIKTKGYTRVAIGHKDKGGIPSPEARYYLQSRHTPIQLEIEFKEAHIKLLQNEIELLKKMLLP